MEVRLKEDRTKNGVWAFKGIAPSRLLEMLPPISEWLYILGFARPNVRLASAAKAALSSSSEESERAAELGGIDFDERGDRSGLSCADGSLARFFSTSELTPRILLAFWLVDMGETALLRPPAWEPLESDARSLCVNVCTGRTFWPSNCAALFPDGRRT